MNVKTYLLAALLAITTATLQAWDDSGHLVINAIASRKLQPGVVKKIGALLPLLDTRFNQGHPYNIITAGCWLDDMRGLGKENPWSRWHYIDVPCNGNTFAEPPPPHALWALDQATSVLRSKNAEPKARAEALAQVMHIVGDIHQPLHTATRGDRGGNDVPIGPWAEDNAGPTNLHAFWDGAYRYVFHGGKNTELFPWQRRPESSDEMDHITQLALVLEAIAPGIGSVSASQHPWREWARETHGIACESGWPKEWVNGNKEVPLRLTPAFVNASHEIAVQQVAKAGERLAALLNELLGEEKAPLKTDRSPTPPSQSAH